MCDFDIKLGDKVLDAEMFARLCPDTVYLLEYERLADPFTSFDSYGSIKPFAKLDQKEEVDRAFGDNFPEITDTAEFDRELNKIAELLLDNLDVFGVNINNGKAGINRDNITPLLKAALRLVNKEWKLQNHNTQNTRNTHRTFPDSSAAASPDITTTSPLVPHHLHYLHRKQRAVPFPPSKVALEFDKELSGSKAYGVADCVIHVRHFVLPVLDARRQSLTTNDCLYQAVAAMMVSRERVYRHFASRADANNETIQQVLHKMPSFGVISTSEKWRFVQYEMHHDPISGECRGHLTKSRDYSVLLDSTWSNKESLTKELSPILDILCGALLHQLKCSDSLEAAHASSRTQKNANREN